MNKTLDVVALGEGMLEFNQTQAGRPDFLQGFAAHPCRSVMFAPTIRPSDLPRP